MQEPLDFEAALAEEQKLGGMPAKGQALGLAFSGGGIRSATFNLGVIQALAANGLLRRFHYLSTISGGGYIGSWLTLFIKRYAGGKVEDAERLLVGRDARGLEHPAIRFLRSFSNYLTPHVGLSKDTLVAVATYLRNLLLNLTILVALLGAVLLLPRFAAQMADGLQSWQSFGAAYLYLMIALLLAPAFAAALGLLHVPRKQDSGVHRPWFLRAWTLRLMIDLPVLLAAFVTAIHYAKLGDQASASWSWFLTTVVAYFLLWLIGVVLAVAFIPEAKSEMRGLMSRDKAKWHVVFVAVAVLAGLLGAALLLAVARAIVALPAAHQLWVTVALGPPAVIGAIMLMIVAHIGFMGRLFGEPERELWSVFGARLMTLALCWAALFAVAFYGAPAIRFANDWVVGLGGAAWVLSTLFGVLAARSKSTGAPDSNRAVELLTRLAPYAFVAGLLLVLSWGVHRVLAEAPGARQAVALPAAAGPVAPPAGVYLRTDRAPGSPVVTVSDYRPPALWRQFTEIAADETASIQRWFQPAWALPAMVLGALLAALLLSWRVNINVFSLHHFYRNRLTRCYLGATNDRRKPHALTGFDENDDVCLADLVGQKPLHIVGTAINMTRGRQLAWQSRKAASFTFTPLHAGYEPASAQVSGGFQPVAQYGLDAEGKPFKLGTAIAISGAAASPNMGYHTSPAVAFLLSVFNVRLGHWCGDTGKGKNYWPMRDPILGLRYWFAELTGSADQDHPFVSLSDGGHFENLGIYELVRRRCALIVASDAGADPKYAFEDLAEAIRKCYTDFGVEFEFADGGVDAIRPVGDQPSKRHYAVAKILYPDGAPGTLVYWKASITEGMPPDIMHYKRTMNDFPHQSTADQFFDESQFESYRNLGYEVANRSLQSLRGANALPPGTL